MTSLQSQMPCRLVKSIVENCRSPPDVPLAPCHLNPPLTPAHAGISRPSNNELYEHILLSQQSDGTCCSCACLDFDCCFCLLTTRTARNTCSIALSSNQFWQCCSNHPCLSSTSSCHTLILDARKRCHSFLGLPSFVDFVAALHTRFILCAAP